MASVGTIKYKNGSSWVDILHPVGSCWLSHQSTSPANLFGGTWTQLTNAVLRAANEYGYSGSDNMTLTVSQMPQHDHHLQFDAGWEYNSSAGDRMCYGRYNSGGRPGWLYTTSNGGGQSFSKLPRYCNIYCWVRTA